MIIKNLIFKTKLPGDKLIMPLVAGYVTSH